MDKNTVMWVIGDEAYECERVTGLCPMCGALDSIVALPLPLLAKQPDDTTHVCHPGFRGCNHGFAQTEVVAH